MMGQVIDLCLEQLTFGGLEFEAMHPQAVKNNSHPLKMLRRRLRVDDHIIQVDEAVGEV